MTLRAIHAVDEKSSAEPEWMAAFLLSLERDDLAPATVRGYRYDLRHFLAWRRTVQDGAFVIQDLAEHDLIAYRQHMVAAGRRPAAINRRLEALRRLCRWARGTGALTSDVAQGVRPVRTVRDRQPERPRTRPPSAPRRPIFQPALTPPATLRAIRYRALLHRWAFRS
jgi:site-specific recombinase XerC